MAELKEGYEQPDSQNRSPAATQSSLATQVGEAVYTSAQIRKLLGELGATHNLPSYTTIIHRARKEGLLIDLADYGIERGCHDSKFYVRRSDVPRIAASFGIRGILTPEIVADAAQRVGLP